MSSSSSRGYKNTRGDSASSRQDKSNVVAEVKRLFKRGGSDMDALVALRSKHNDMDLIDAIYEQYKDRQEYIVSKARKFKRVIYDRYADQNLSVPQLIKKARKYKDKYNLDEAEFEFFLHSVVSDRHAGIGAHVPSTKMSRVFGYTHAMLSGEKLRVKEEDMSVLNDILRAHGQTRQLHGHVWLQSLSYQSCAPSATGGTYERVHMKDAYSFVHPALAMMFLPKVELLDQQMLIASISNIVKRKYEGKVINAAPDFNLYWSMVSDKNDLVCDMDNPMKDLRNRVNLQIQIWNCVLNLRQGKYYNNQFAGFLDAVDACRNNIYDAPDLAYSRDEGVLVRKILGAFSLRPTVISTAPLYGVMPLHPFLGASNMADISSVPMISLRIPFNPDLQPTGSPTKFNLSQVYQQPQWFVENKVLVPKIRTIIYTRDVIFFHINRRYFAPQLGKLHAPYNFTALPLTVSSYQRVNKFEVECPKDGYKLGASSSRQSYNLQSALLVRTVNYKGKNSSGNDEDVEVIAGCKALVRCGSEWQCYNPAKASDVTNGQKSIDKIVGPLEKDENRINTHATVLMYVESSRQGQGLGAASGADAASKSPPVGVAPPRALGADMAAELPTGS